MENFKEKECERQQSLIENSKLFDETPGGGIIRGAHPYVLKEGLYNLYAPIREDALQYYRENNIAWWRGAEPTGHVLSSQIACINHLFLLRNDADAVLAMLNNIRNEFVEVLPIPSDANPSFIAFEVVSDSDHLNEGYTTRGSNCTSIDAMIYARHKFGEMWIIPIEWKYTERYENKDYSNEDREGEEKGGNGRGKKRMSRYNDLISASGQLKSLNNYAGSIYYFEPFYQLMRQTLWAEKVVENRATERLAADNYLHIHVVPVENNELLNKKYNVSGEGMEKSWRGMLTDKSKYIIIDPEKLLAPIAGKYPTLTDYLSMRYWCNK